MSFKSFKNTLQEFCHKNNLPHPVYTTQHVNTQFQSNVKVDEYNVTSNMFTTKQAAETHAAELLYKKLVKSVQINISPKNQPLILIDGDRCSDVAMKIQEYFIGLDLANVYLFVNSNYEPPKNMIIPNIIRAKSGAKNASDVELIYNATQLYQTQTHIIIVSKNQMMAALQDILADKLNVPVKWCQTYGETTVFDSRFQTVGLT